MNREASTKPFSDDQPTPSIPWVLDIWVDEALLQVKVREQLIIGRGTGAGAPDVDLTAFRAEQNGVSRRHAIIVARQRFLTIRDLGSTNGTHVNNLPLPADQEVPLEHDDVVTFGSLETRLAFAVLPPHTRASADSNYETLRPQIPGAGQHVLIIEDDDEVALAYQLMLRSYGFRVSVASEPEEAAIVCESALPDAVVLDLHLQHSGNGYGGLDVLHWLQHRMAEVGYRVPVIVVTGLVDEEHRYHALEAGATVFLNKPVRVDELAIRVGTLIAQNGPAQA